MKTLILLMVSALFAPSSFADFELPPARLILVSGAQVIHEFGCGAPPPPGMPRPTCPDLTRVSFQTAFSSGVTGCENTSDIFATVVQSGNEQVIYISRSRAECLVDTNSNYFGRLSQVSVQLANFVHNKPTRIANPILVQNFARP